MTRALSALGRVLLGTLLCTCCSSDVPPDAASTQPDAGLDATMDSSRLDAPEVGALDAPRRDVPAPFDARLLPDAQFDDAEWLPFPGVAPECAVRLARDPEASVGRWAFEPCGPIPGCQALRQHSFIDRPGERVFFERVDGERLVAGTATDLLGGGRADVFFLTRSGRATLLVRSVSYSWSDPDVRSSSCRASDVAIRGPDSLFVFDDLREADDRLRGARYPIQRSLDAGEWETYAVLTDDGLSGNYPQNIAFGRDLVADRVATSNRIVTIRSDGSYRFTEPAPPYDRVRVHSVPSVVGEHWIASAGISGTRNGLFMSHLGEPSIRVREVDAVGEVVANETDIVWLEGSRLTEGTRLDDTTLWRAPWRPGPIDPAEARAVRAIPEVAQLFPESLNPGHGYLRLRLGNGYVAIPDAMGNRCHVVRLSDGAMATVAPPGYRCQRTLSVNETEVALGLIEEGDTAGTTVQLWLVPMAALTFEP